MILLIIIGYAAAGKSTVSFDFAKKHDYALINQDHFLFKMNPSSLAKNAATKTQHKITHKTLLTCTEIYMQAKQNIVLEGALVSISDGDPICVEDFIILAKKHKYTPVVLSLIADEKIRKKRQKKRKNVLNPEIDKMLIAAHAKQNIKDNHHIVDTTKHKPKHTLQAIEEIINSYSQKFS